MNHQELFDKVVTHLLEQGERSEYYDEEYQSLRCAYRGDNGRKCAVGCLIADERYQKGLEGHGVQTIGVLTAVERSIGRQLEQSTQGMLWELQKIHDSVDPENWREEIHGFVLASKYRFNLEWKHD